MEEWIANSIIEGIDGLGQSLSYERALLNVKPDGEKLTRISWSGCPHGERRVTSNAKETTNTM